MKRQLTISLVILILMIVATVLIILYGKGYRFSFNQGNPEVAGTGLLVATSSPDGASVYINGRLATATDNTINLSPGQYDVRIFKDGYSPWEKQIIIHKEVVSKADALLLPTAPKLENITNIGVLNPILDPTGTKVAYAVASQSANRNGIYVLDMSIRPILTLQSASTQIVSDASLPFSTADYSWSPESNQLIATFSATATTYLMTSEANALTQDVTSTLNLVDSSWNKLKTEKFKARIDSLPKKLKPVVISYFNILEWSDDETKILYTASRSANLPTIINPPLIGVNSTPEQRGISKGAVYAYDIKEDRNYKILDSLNKTGVQLPIMFHPDSKHLIYVHDKKINIMDYDGINSTTVYAGPFVDTFVFPWPDATKIVILTNLGNENQTPNLYTISLK